VFSVSAPARRLLIPVRPTTAVRSLAVVEKALLGIAVVAALFGGRAVAADLEASTPPPPPAPNWSGPYIGVGVAARYNAVDANITSASVGTPPTAIPLPNVSAGYTNPFLWWGSGPGAMQFIDNISIGVRVYGGWNYQVAPAWVVGVEGDFAYANESAVFHGSPYPANLLFGSPSLPFGATPNDEFKVRTTWDGSARLRGGWLATPSMLLYLTGGLAWAQLEVTSTCSTVATANVSNCAAGNYFGGTLGPGAISHSAIKLGWTAGAGAEVLFWSNWVARVQYRFSDFGYVSGSGVSFTDTRTCSGCAAANTPLTVSYELPMMQHNFEVGIAYKFGP
jgi:outer membrane immunogenic protein